MDIEFSGEIWYWRGPSPFYFVTVPEQESRMLKSVSAMVTYGWGVIPVRVRSGGTAFTTSLFPKDGLYIVARVINPARRLSYHSEAPADDLKRWGGGAQHHVQPTLRRGRRRSAGRQLQRR